ncbi:MAG: TetR/AcrR family transcriptional regulator [Caulobacteraceae bacterium]
MTSEHADRQRRPPRQDRSQQTYERLLDVTGALLAEVGVESISTNMICSRAGMTPPALYRYFKDKYAVIEALSERLMARRAVVVEAWLSEHAPGGVAALAGNVEPLLRALVRSTAEQPGALWVFRAMRALPRLTQLRVEAQRRTADRLAEVYSRMMPHVPRKMLWTRARVAVEFSFATDEMITTAVDEANSVETREELETIFYEAGRMLGSLFFFEENPRR